MKTIHLARYVGGALCALIVLGAHAQGGSDTASTPVASAAGGAGKADKAAQAANRQLQKSVRRALAHTKELQAAGIAVRARDGVVTLQGWVPEQSQVATAIHVTQGVDGVKSVNNQLMVRPVGQ